MYTVKGLKQYLQMSNETASLRTAGE